MDALGLRVPVRSRGGTRALAALGDLLRAHERLQVDQRLVHRGGGPHPLPHRVEAVAARGLAGPPVPHHVPGVLRIRQHLPDAGGGPAPRRPRCVHRRRRRMGQRIGVQPVRDLPVAELLRHPPRKALRHHGSLDWMSLEQRLLHALGPSRRHRVRHPPGAVAVAGLADVVALLGMRLKARPGLLQQLGDVPLGHPLLHPTNQHLRGAPAPPAGTDHPDRLIRRPQHHPRLLQPVLELRRHTGAPRNAIDRLANDRIEPAIRTARLPQQRTDIAIPGDGDVHLLMCGPTAAVGESRTPGLHVVEVSSDDRTLRQSPLAHPELSRQRQRRILQIECRRPSQPRHHNHSRTRSGPGLAKAAG